ARPGPRLHATAPLRGVTGKARRREGSPEGPPWRAFAGEHAVWPVPARDLAQAVDPSCHISGSPDLATYWAVVRERWPNCDQTDIERLATCGAVWRALAVITWGGHHLTRPWADAFLPNLRMYEAELTHALDRFGWPAR